MDSETQSEFIVFCVVLTDPKKSNECRLTLHSMESGLRYCWPFKLCIQVQRTISELAELGWIVVNGRIVDGGVESLYSPFNIIQYEAIIVMLSPSHAYFGWRPSGEGITPLKLCKP